MMKMNENREENSLKEDQGSIDSALFKYLAIAYSIFTTLALINLLTAYLLRGKKHGSFGMMLPFSALIVFLCLLISIFLILFAFQDRRLIGLQKWWTKIFLSSRITAGVTLVLIELFLLSVFAIFTINSLLFQPLYIGLTPALFLLITLPVSSLVLLLKYDRRFTRFVQSVFSLPLLQVLLLCGSIIGYIIFGFLFSRRLFLLLNGSTQILASNQLISEILLFALILLLIDVIFLIIAFWSFPQKKISYLFDSYPLHNEKKAQPITKRSLFKHPVFISFLITSVFSVIILALFRIRYDTNDDIQMISILSGYLGGTPSVFSVFGNVILGFLFQFLFKLRADVNWVVYFYLLVNFCSIWGLVYCFLNLQMPKVYKYFGALIVLLFDCYYLSVITYTTVAATACLTGLCMLLNSIYKKNNLASLIFGNLLVLIGSLIRPEAILLVVVLFIPYFLINLKHFLSMKTIGVVLLLTFLVLGGSAFNSLYIHESPKWADFENYIKVRQALIDTPRMSNVPTNAAAYQTVSWSKNDISAFLNGIPIDKSVFSQNTLQSLVNQISNWRTDISQIFDQLLTTTTTGDMRVLLLLTIATWLQFLLTVKKKRDLITSVFLLLELIGILFVLVWGYKAPNRVVASMYMTFSIVLLLMVDWPGNQNQEDGMFNRNDSANVFYPAAYLLIFCLGLGIGLTAITLNNNVNTDKIRENFYTTVNSDVSGLIKSGKIQSNALIISAGDGYPVQLMNPLQLEFPPVQVLPLGWNTFSPAYDSVLTKYRIDSVGQALITRSDVYIVSRKDFMTVVTDYYKEHENIDVSIKEIYILGGPDSAVQTGNYLVLYQLIKN